MKKKSGCNKSQNEGNTDGKVRSEGRRKGKGVNIHPQL